MVLNGRKGLTLILTLDCLFGWTVGSWGRMLPHHAPFGHRAAWQQWYLYGIGSIPLRLVVHYNRARNIHCTGSISNILNYINYIHKPPTSETELECDNDSLPLISWPDGKAAGKISERLNPNKAVVIRFSASEFQEPWRIQNTLTHTYTIIYIYSIYTIFIHAYIIYTCTNIQ